MIKLKNVSFSYASGDKKNGLQNVTLSIKPGEVILLCGESGCGKTTLTRLLNGLIPHYYVGELDGKAQIDGRDVSKLPLYETAKKVGSVFQNPRSQFFNVDTTAELAFGCENQGLPTDEILRRITEIASDFKLNRLMGRSLFQLSGGEKQKIACAAVSAAYPDILVLDEPSSNLDMEAVDDLRKYIALWKKEGKTIVIAEHRVYYLRELVDRIVVMKEGKIENILSSALFCGMNPKALFDMGIRPLCLKSLSRTNPYTEGLSDALVISDMTFSYRKETSALNICELKIPGGSITAIIGPNGAGKSTFARCLCALETRCKGTLFHKGRTLKGKEKLKYCYMVMQDVNHQLFAESVLDEVLLSMEEECVEEAEKILSELDLLSFKECHPLSLSGGQKQRVAIAGAVASHKDIVVFDEPTSGLDLKHMHEVALSLKKLQSKGKTLFVISHDLELILNCCTHVLHLQNGMIRDVYALDDAGENKLMRFFLKE